MGPVFRDQVMFSARWTLRNLVFFTVSTGEPWMSSDSWFLCSPEVNNHLFGFVYIQGQVVDFAAG